MIVPETSTGGDGRFSLDLSAETDHLDLLVMAPGFVFRDLPVVLAKAAELEVALSQEEGGTLTIGLRKPWPSFEFRDRRPYVLLSDGFMLDLQTLSLWASMNGVYAEDEPVLSVPLLPSDTYTVCWPVEGTKRETTCKSGFLPIGGRLVMSVGST